MKKISIVCQVCGKTKEVYPYVNGGERKYCSFVCYNKSREKVFVPCTFCGAKKLLNPFRVKNGRDKYCSLNCYHQSRKKRAGLEGTELYSKKELIANKNLKRLYGISLEQKQQMFTSQNGKCAICFLPITLSGKQSSTVDHNHSTGKVRQLLCHSCNCGLGNFGESIINLKSAINYLEKWL